MASPAKKDECLEEVHIPLLESMKRSIANNTNRAFEDLYAMDAPTMSPKDQDMYKLDFRTRLFHHVLPVIVGGSAITEQLKDVNLKPIGWITDDIDVKFSVSLRCIHRVQEDIKLLRLLFIKYSMKTCRMALANMKANMDRVGIASCKIFLKYGRDTFNDINMDIIKKLADATDFKTFKLSTIYASYTLTSGEEILFPVSDIVIFGSFTTHSNMWKDYLRNVKRTFVGSVPAYARNIGWSTKDGFTYIGNIEYLILDTIRMLHNADVIQQLVEADPSLPSTIKDSVFRTFLSNTKKYPKYWIKLLQLFYLYRQYIQHIPYSEAEMGQDMLEVKNLCDSFVQMQGRSHTPKEYIETLIDMHQKMKSSRLYSYISDTQMVPVVDKNIKKVFNGGNVGSPQRIGDNDGLSAKEQTELDSWRASIDPSYESYEAYRLKKEMDMIAAVISGGAKKSAKKTHARKH